MERLSDHDGKSESASAPGRAHYPGLHDLSSLPATEPTPAEIAERARQLWLEQGMPPHSAEQNWLDAERELKAAIKSRSLVEKVHEKAGSVQR